MCKALRSNTLNILHNLIIIKCILSLYQRILEAVYKTPIGQPLKLDPLEYLPPPKERSLQFRIRKHYRR